METCRFPPKVSIVIATYNRAYCLGEAIESALAQTLPVAEILIIDDGSTDNTAEVVSSFNSDKLRYLKKENGGLSDARNWGVRESAGDSVIWLDDDDLLLPHAHEAYIDELSRDPNIDIVYGNYRLVDVDGNELCVWKCDDFYRNNAFYISRLLIGRRIPHGGSMWHKSVYEKYGMYDLAFKRASDYDLFARIAPHVSFKNAGSIVYVYKIHDTNMSCPERKTNYVPELTVVNRVLKRFSLKELFPAFDWSNEKVSRAKAYITIGNVFAKYNEYDTAYDYMEGNIEILEKHREITSEDLPWAYISMGNIYLHREDYPEALVYFNKSIEAEKTARGYYKLAVVYNKMGDDEKAEHYYKKTLELAPNHKAARAELYNIVTLSRTTTKHSLV